MKLTKEDEETIQNLEQRFESNEMMAESDRVSLGTKLETLGDYYKKLSESYEGLQNLDSETVRNYAEAKTLSEIFYDLQEKYIRLDNYRCHNLAILSNLLYYTDLEVCDKIKNYEF